MPPFDPENFRQLKVVVRVVSVSTPHESNILDDERRIKSGQVLTANLTLKSASSSFARLTSNLGRDAAGYV